MFDLGWSELLIVGVVAIIVVGPKEMPRVVRSVTNFIGKVRNMAWDFQNSMNKLVYDEDLSKIRQELMDENDGLKESFRDAEYVIKNHSGDKSSKNNKLKKSINKKNTVKSKSSKKKISKK